MVAWINLIGLHVSDCLSVSFSYAHFDSGIHFLDQVCSSLILRILLKTFFYFFDLFLLFILGIWRCRKIYGNLGEGVIPTRLTLRAEFSFKRLN